MSIKLKPLTASLLLILPLATNALDRIDLLPSGGQTYVRVSNTTNFWSKLKQSSIGKLCADPQFLDFVGNPDAETWEELLFDGEADAEDRVMLEQLKMLTGEVILAFDWEEESPFIIAAMTQKDFDRSLDMDAKLTATLDSSFEIIKSTFQDVEIIQHIEQGETPEENSSWQAYLKGTFLFGNSKEWVEKSIVQLKKETPEEPKGNPTFTLTVPLTKLIREDLLEDLKAEAAQAPSMFDPESLLNALGLMGIESYSLKIELKEREMVADSTLRVSDLTKGVFTILDLQPSELPTVSFIPEAISSIEVGRFNLLRFWQEIPTVLASAMPSVKPQFDMIVAMVQQQAGINFEQDLLANLETKYLSFSVAETDRQTSVIAIGLKNSAAFKAGLETAIAAPALQPQVAAGLEIEDFLDHTIYTLNDHDPSSAIAFSVTDDYLIYGQPEGLRQVIRSKTSEAAANTAFEQSVLVKGLREHVPARAFGYSAIDWKKNMTVLIREFSKPQYVALIQQSWARSGAALPPPDFSKLPPADHIASFFNASFQYAEATNDGIHHRIILKY